MQILPDHEEDDEFVGDDFEEDYPGQKDEIRRERLIQKAVEAGDRIICEGANGTVEELNYLTAKVAEKWATKMATAMTGQLLRNELEARFKREA